MKNFVNLYILWIKKLKNSMQSEDCEKKYSEFIYVGYAILLIKFTVDLIIIDFIG